MTYGEGVNVYLQVHQSRACCNMPELAPNTQQCTVVQILTICLCPYMWVYVIWILFHHHGDSWREILSWSPCFAWHQAVRAEGVAFVPMSAHDGCPQWQVMPEGENKRPFKNKNGGIFRRINSVMNLSFKKCITVCHMWHIGYFSKCSFTLYYLERTDSMWQHY